MRQLKLVFTGTGRCATGFYARWLASAGIECGHEALFNLAGIGRAKQQMKHQQNLRADSSWLAAPFLDDPLFNDVLIVHLVRHPKEYINSELGLRAFTADNFAGFLLFTRQNLSNVQVFDDAPNLPTKSAIRWLQWNRMIEEKGAGRDVIRFNIERHPDELLAILQERGVIGDVNKSKLFSNRKHNTRQGESWDVSLSDIAEPIRSQVLERCAEYGYSWSDDVEVTERTPVIKAVITTMDNLQNNKEQLHILSSDPLISEIIFVNQGSRDGTREWLDAQNNIKIIHRENLGAGPGRNAGIDAAGQFDYLLLLDGGIRPLRRGVERMLEYLQAHPKIDTLAPDWHDLETDYTKAWRRWARPIQDGDTYRNSVLSLTHYCLSRARCWDNFRFSEIGPFAEPGWGADDDEMAHRWKDGGIVVHAIKNIKVYRHASGSHGRLKRETGIGATDYGSVYEKRLVWLQQEQPQHKKGDQWGEPWLTVVVAPESTEDAARIIKAAHDQLRKRRFAPPWDGFWNPYSVVLWSQNKDVLNWAEPRRLRQQHGNKHILDEYGPDRTIVYKTGTHADTWAGDFRVWTGDDWHDAIRENANYYGLVHSLDELDKLLKKYNDIYPRQSKNKGPAVKRQCLHIM